MLRDIQFRADAFLFRRHGRQILDVFIQRDGHVVEGCGEISDFVVRGDFDSSVQIALTDDFDVFFQTDERSGDGSGRLACEHDDGDDDDDECGQKKADGCLNVAVDCMYRPEYKCFRNMDAERPVSGGDWREGIEDAAVGQGGDIADAAEDFIRENMGGVLFMVDVFEFFLVKLQSR